MAFNPDTLPNLAGRVYIVTGGNTGIGYFTVFHLAKHHAKVYMGARNEEKARSAIESIKEDIPYAEIEFLLMDMMDLSSVVAAAKSILQKESRLHGIVNNAGIMAVPQQTSKDGYESQWQTNYMSHWLLTKHLLPLLLSTAALCEEGTVRVTNVSSVGHKYYTPSTGIDFGDINQVKGGSWSRYGQSKLANILHSKELLRRYGPGGTELSTSNTPIWTASVHPGNYDTQLNKNAKGLATAAAVLSPILKCLRVTPSVDVGSYNSLYTIASPDFSDQLNGKYFVPVAKVETPSKFAEDPELATKLWEWTDKEMQAKGFI
ncbi:hypothetical protein N5P37_010089 [Trichoderma harzianum]|uniref:Uncharacterized protein n=1 Tax=Trichoderma harzianum CBS 226.95 TaxID=983964 RepID=A0A2T4A587_TRIHA|nr:hypothetical protein M431DRAFT_484274 [Trichoderma harzianum CBS 226.95]KAK0757367.1 hypothetical protein N5P37_010089 [Trichoderma harzianum]PKK53517.1 hypothetical protein CI102_1933 [Trichoderma harzianum]PTB52206.1 hypothetical protein M431DRAFT_484274 [Trichoderma harzianum CBS 226.95]